MTVGPPFLLVPLVETGRSWEAHVESECLVTEEEDVVDDGPVEVAPVSSVLESTDHECNVDPECVDP